MALMAAAVVVACAIWWVHPSTAGRHVWGNSVQLVGTIVAAMGLANAYTNVRYGRGLRRQIVFLGKGFGAQVAWWWRLWFGRGSGDVLIAPGTAVLGFGGGKGTAVVTDRFVFDPALPSDQQFAAMAVHLNKLDDRSNDAAVGLDRLGGRIDAVAADAVTAASQALANARAEIAELSGLLARAQALDLRWAIVGLVIGAVGLALSY
jgi:hypothetical protein